MSQGFLSLAEGTIYTSHQNLFKLEKQLYLNYRTHNLHPTIPEESKTRFVSYGYIYCILSINSKKLTALQSNAPHHWHLSVLLNCELPSQTPLKQEINPWINPGNQIQVSPQLLKTCSYAFTSISKSNYKQVPYQLI